MKPTAGKWKVAHNEFASWVESDKKVPIAKIFRPNGMPAEEAHANGRLLAAAPDLLAALELVYDAMRHLPEFSRYTNDAGVSYSPEAQARLAIALANGK